MSWFSSLLGKIEKVFKNLFGSTATAAQTINTAVKVLSPIITAIVTKAAGTTAATEVSNIIKEVQTDLATITTTIQAMGLSGTGATTVETSLDAIKDNLRFDAVLSQA